MDGNILLAIEQRLSAFSKGKQQIATYILENSNEAAFQTAAQIGKAVKISESTVVRFAGDLGYKGFPDFQRALQQVVKAQLLKTDSGLSEQLPTCSEDPFCYDIEKDCRSLQTLLKAEYRKCIEEFALELSHCRDLYLIASSLGQLLLSYVKYSFEMVLDTVKPLSLYPKETLFMELTGIMPGDRILAFAVGEPDSTFLFALDQAKRMGAHILLITDSSLDTVKCLGDHVLSISSQREEMIPNFTQLTGLVYGLVSLVKTNRSPYSVERNNIFEEIQNAYDKFEP